MRACVRVSECVYSFFFLSTSFFNVCVCVLVCEGDYVNVDLRCDDAFLFTHDELQTNLHEQTAPCLVRMISFTQHQVHENAEFHAEYPAYPAGIVDSRNGS